MLQIKVNNHLDFTIGKSGKQLLVDDNLIAADFKALADNKWHVIHERQSYNVEVISFDKIFKTSVIKINGSIYNLTAKDQFDLLLDKLGLNHLNTSNVGDIKAPMPGLVIKLFIEDGMEIKKGDNLFVLEAMKMENIIKSPADAFIKSVKIKQGDKVEKGQVMIQL